MKNFIIILGLFIGACSTCPKVLPTVVEAPISVHATHIDAPECPVLPIYGLSKDSNWDVRLKAWDASLIILKGCDQAKGNIIKELNK